MDFAAWCRQKSGGHESRFAVCDYESKPCIVTTSEFAEKLWLELQAKHQMALVLPRGQVLRSPVASEFVPQHLRWCNHFRLFMFDAAPNDDVRILLFSDELRPSELAEALRNIEEEAQED